MEAHAKLLATELLGLTVDPFSASFSTSAGHHVSNAEIIGMIVTRERRNDYLRFHVDDGTGCVPCVLWLNQRHLIHSSSHLDLLAGSTQVHVEKTQLGSLVCVRGRVSVFRGAVELVVSRVAVERDPHAEVLHWLQCISLARRCYGRCPLLETVKRKKQKISGEDD
ncbi:nucleic acid-binding, OB-fold-like protein [Wolffia australiana]